jgi:hypothetical protein
MLPISGQTSERHAEIRCPAGRSYRQLAMRRRGDYFMSAEIVVVNCIPGELDEMIILCLIDYWIRHGLTCVQAEAAACKALEKLRSSPNNQTWCLLPDCAQLT